MNLDNGIYVCDCESDGFLDSLTKIHTFGIGWKTKDNSWALKDTAKYDDMIKVLSDPTKVCVFHNGYLFDKKALEKVLGIEVKAFIIDTLPLSWALFPNRLKYGLEFFAEDYGLQKPKIESWTDLTYEEYANRVREDVKINIALWEDCLNYLKEIYDGDLAKIESYLRFLAEVMQIVADQETYGIKLDINKCRENLEILTKMAQEKIDILKTIMPKIPIKSKRTKPKNMFKKDGSLSSSGERWMYLVKACGLPDDYDGVIEEITGYSESNPVSVSQVKQYLFSLGWIPEIYVETVNTKGELKQVEQIKDKDKNLCKSVLKLVEKVPELIALDDLSVINHRKSYLESFLKNVQPNGYIQAQIGGLTNTIRLRHKTLVNLPKISAPYGEYVRPVLTCEADEVFVGSDLSSLENYTRTNFVADIDPKAIDILSDPDYDSHTQLAIFAGMMSQEDEDFYKWYKKGTKDRNTLPEFYKVYNDEEISEQFSKLNIIRNKAKTTSYSALYGVGKKKLAKELKISEKEAQQLLDGYWKLNQAVKIFSSQCEVKTVRHQMWVKNPLNGYFYTLRKESDIFSTVNQGAGSYLHILWCAYIRRKGIKIVGNFHDEILTVCKSNDYERVKSLLWESIEAVNKQAKLRVPLKIDVQKGKNYGDVH
jgi:DNA polymerase I-like protein with 3'-5' exonuclease and polymerase domains